jgi:spore germination cell wall hydrolase CwlJ-like protein
MLLSLLNRIFFTATNVASSNYDRTHTCTTTLAINFSCNDTGATNNDRKQHQQRNRLNRYHQQQDQAGFFATNIKSTITRSVSFIAGFVKSVNALATLMNMIRMNEIRMALGNDIECM